MNLLNTVVAPKTGHLLFGIVVPENMTTRDHEQSITYELQAVLKTEVFRTLMDGRAFKIQISTIDSEEYDETNFTYFIQANVFVNSPTETEIGEYTVFEESEQEKINLGDLIFEKDKIGWKRVE